MPWPRRLRVRFGGETVADTRGAHVLRQHGFLPVFYLPIADVRQDLLEPSDWTTESPYRGTAAYWHLRAGDRVAESAVWTYREPRAGSPDTRGFCSFDFHSMDAWYEEEERINRIRDPYHRVDIRPTAAHVTVRAHGEVIAESAQARLLFETGLPPRAYLPLADVRGDVLVANASTTYCPYKGTATYWSVRAGGRTIEDAAWTYAEPYDESAAAAGLISFLADGVEVEIDRSAAPRLRAAA